MNRNYAQLCTEDFLLKNPPKKKNKPIVRRVKGLSDQEFNALISGNNYPCDLISPKNKN